MHYRDFSDQIKKTFSMHYYRDFSDEIEKIQHTNIIYFLTERTGYLILYRKKTWIPRCTGSVILPLSL